MDTYIRNHEDDFIGQAEESLPNIREKMFKHKESLPIKSCRRLFELFDIDTDWLDR